MKKLLLFLFFVCFGNYTVEASELERTCIYKNIEVNVYSSSVAVSYSGMIVTKDSSFSYEAFASECPKSIWVYDANNGSYIVSLTHNALYEEESLSDIDFPQLGSHKVNDAIGGQSKYDSVDKPCNNAGVLRGMKIVGALISIIKILVPIVLIITGVISLGNAVINSDDTKIKPAINALIKKTIVGAIIAFVPSIIYGFTNLIDKYVSTKSDFANCIVCLESLNECDTLINKYEK